MKNRLFRVLAQFFCRWIYLIGYGKEGMKARKILGEDKDDGVVGLLFAFPLIGWSFVMYLLFLDLQSGHPIELKLLAWCVGIPAAFVCWIIWARRASKRFIEEAAKPPEKRRTNQPRTHQKGDWCCPKCRLILDKDISVCYRCGTSKKDAVDFIT